jgi:hypothetical protein
VPLVEEEVPMSPRATAALTVRVTVPTTKPERRAAFKEFRTLKSPLKETVMRAMKWVVILAVAAIVAPVSRADCGKVVVLSCPPGMNGTPMYGSSGYASPRYVAPSCSQPSYYRFTPLRGVSRR